jgi:hypothetical protein
MVASVLALLFWMCCVAFGVVFLLLRLRYRSRMRRGKRPGFYPGVGALGNALHTLQITAVPQIKYVMEEKEDDHAEDADSGDSEDEATMRKHILRQAKRIRRGQHIGALTAIRPRNRRD